MKTTQKVKKLTPNDYEAISEVIQDQIEELENGLCDNSERIKELQKLKDKVDYAK